MVTEASNKRAHTEWFLLSNINFKYKVKIKGTIFISKVKEKGKGKERAFVENEAEKNPI